MNGSIERIRISGEDVAEALIAAGIELRPEDQLMIKFNQVAEILGSNLRSQMRRGLDSFSKAVLWERV